MPLLYHASFKELGSLVCPWHDVKLRKTQLEVRSFNPTWSRDLLGQRVIFFWKCVKLLAEQLWQIWRRYAPPFSRYLRKTLRGGWNQPPPAGARVNIRLWLRFWADCPNGSGFGSVSLHYTYVFLHEKHSKLSSITRVQIASRFSHWNTRDIARSRFASKTPARSVTCIQTEKAGREWCCVSTIFRWRKPVVNW